MKAAGFKRVPLLTALHTENTDLLSIGDVFSPALVTAWFHYILFTLNTIYFQLDKVEEQRCGR